MREIGRLEVKGSPQAVIAVKHQNLLINKRRKMTMQGLIVLSSIAYIIICLLIAFQFHEIAKAKGFDSIKYFWFPFLFGIAGYLLIIALPDRGRTSDNTYAADELPEI